MAKKLNKLLIVDVETTCWENEQDKPEGIINEVIEFGLAEINLQNLIIENVSNIIVKPTDGEISEFCTKLTGWTQEEIDDLGISFQHACKQLKQTFWGWPWMSWGDYDRTQIRHQVKHEHPCSFPFNRTHTNFKHIFSASMGLQQEVGVMKALDMFGMEFEGRHHRGMDDAKNIARIVVEFMNGIRFCEWLDFYGASENQSWNSR